MGSACDSMTATPSPDGDAAGAASDAARSAPVIALIRRLPLDDLDA